MNADRVVDAKRGKAASPTFEAETASDVDAEAAAACEDGDGGESESEEMDRVYGRLRTGRG